MHKRKMIRNLGVGVGLRDQHYTEFLRKAPPPAKWVEVNAENYISSEDSKCENRLQVLTFVREHMPVFLHGTSMSLGSTSTSNREYLKNLKKLADHIEPEQISDHLCWSGIKGVHLHDLLPLPFTEECIEVVVPRITQAQDYLKRQIMVENLSSYLEFEDSEMSEWEFLSEVARRADCNILLDINNVYVCSQNHGWDPRRYLEEIPHERVYQIHLAGHENRGDLIIDTHSEYMIDPVWDLYQWYIETYGTVSSMIEWDSKIPTWKEMAAELSKIEHLMTQADARRLKCA